MGIIVKYKFNQSTYANLLPEFNSGFTDYTYTDETDTDGYTIRTIGNDSGNLPTLIRFGSGAKSLLSVEYINTSEVTDMSSMFQNCSSLTTLDLSNFNTSQVTNMASMFRSCSKLTSLDLSSFDTSQVTGMGSMFYNCSNLTSLDLSNFDTSQVTNMASMFRSCSKLTSLDLSSFDTSQVTGMAYMFRGCSSLTSLDLSNFNTSNVNDMSYMFYDCSLLATLDLSNFNTTKVTDFTNIFANTSKLTNIGLLYALASTINSLSSNMGTDIARIIWYQDADATELNSVTNIETKLYKTNILTCNEEVVLRSNGDVYDELNLLTGKLTQRIGEVIVDGSSDEDWYMVSGGSSTHERFTMRRGDNPKPISNVHRGLFLCDKLKTTVSIAGSVSSEVCLMEYYDNYFISIVVDKTKLDSVDVIGFRSWLQSNNLKFQYQLETESIKTINLSSSEVYAYDGITHYTCSSEVNSLLPTACIEVPIKEVE